VPYIIEDPRQIEYDIHAAARNRDGEYSDSVYVPIDHPGIQTIDLQEYHFSSYFSSFTIELPKPYSEVSQTVYPSSVTSEVKDILGYRIYIREQGSTTNRI